MTLWNPLNILSRANSGPRAMYDPGRTGDPISPLPAEPLLGTGTTLDRGTAVSTGRRNPIGFAPPSEPEPLRFQTEIAFKRHHESPRASVVPTTESPGGEVLPTWQTPSSEPVLPAVEPAVAEAPVEPRPAETVPFYRREISFRRRKHDESAETLGAATDDDAEIEVDTPADGPVVAEVPAVEIEPEENPDDGTDGPRVPFYKRELSFRRSKKADEALVAEVETGGDVVEADVDPLEVVAVAAAAEAASDPDELEAEAIDGAAESAAVDETAAHAESDPVAEAGEAPIEETRETQVEESEGDAPPLVEPVAETEPDAADEAPAEDELPAAAPASGGRFRTRKERAPKRKGKSQRVVGLKIGASQLAAAVMARTDNGSELVELTRRPLDSGIVVDGEVRDEAALAAAVRSFFEDERLPRSDVRIGLSSNRIGVRTIDIPGVEDEARFDNAVRFKAHEVLPVALHESVLDYRVLSKQTTPAGEEIRRVLLVVAPQDQVAPYQRVAASAGLGLTGVDLEALALLRAFVDPVSEGSAPAETATVVVGIGHEASTLLVAGAGACEFTRVFDWGGGDLADAIAATLEVRPAEAMTVLRHVSLDGPGRKYEPLDEGARVRATDAVRQRLTPFARELVQSLQFYQTQAGSLGIGKIVITGGTSALEGLDVTLQQMIGVEVSVGDPLARVSHLADFGSSVDASLGSLAVPIGLAIDDDTRSVNLLPKDAVGKQRNRRAAAISVGVPVAVAVPIAALALLYLGAHGQVSDRQHQVDAIQAQIAALPVPKTPVFQSNVTADEAQRATAVANLIGGRVAWDTVLGDFTRVLPANVWLNSVSFAEPDPTSIAAVAAAASPATGQTSTTPSAVSIDGYTYTQPDVARLLARLATLPSLQNVTLTSSAADLVGTRQVVHFVIVADLAETGGAS